MTRLMGRQTERPVAKVKPLWGRRDKVGVGGGGENCRQTERQKEIKGVGVRGQWTPTG